MAKSSSALVDTDILIKIYRGDKEKRKIIEPIQDNLAISLITAVELLAGATSRNKKYEVLKTVRAYHIIEITEAVGKTAFNLSKKYCVEYEIGVADILIAATAIVNNLPLYTDNIRHFEFIEELVLYK